MANCMETGEPFNSKMATADSLMIQDHINTERYEPKTPKFGGDNEDERRFYSFKNLQFESVRRATFKNWNVKFLTPEQMAKAGFFYTQSDDQVQCYLCRGVIGYWEKGDDPWVEHEKHYPNCPLIQGSAVTNIPVDDSPVHIMLMNYLKERVREPSPPPRKRTYQTDSAVVYEKEKPIQFPDYENKEKRMASFNKERKVRVPPPEKMVKAGLFLVGIGDLSQCYSCGGGIFNWNIHEDPEETHDALYPNCRLTKARKSSKGQVDSETDSEMEVVTSKKRKITEEEKLLLPELPLAKKMSRIGWSDKMIAEALAYELDTYGTLPVDINEASDALNDHEERMNAGGDGESQ